MRANRREGRLRPPSLGAALVLAAVGLGFAASTANATTYGCPNTDATMSGGAYPVTNIVASNVMPQNSRFGNKPETGRLGICWVERELTQRAALGAVAHRRRATSSAGARHSRAHAP